MDEFMVSDYEERYVYAQNFVVALMHDLLDFLTCATLTYYVISHAFTLSIT